MIKRSALQEDLPVLYVYAPNNISLRETKTNRTARRERGVRSHGRGPQHLSEMDLSSMQKASKDTMEHNTTVNQVDIIDIHK